MLAQLPSEPRLAVQALLEELLALGIAPDALNLSQLELTDFEPAEESKSDHVEHADRQAPSGWPDLSTAREVMSQLPVGAQAIVLAAAEEPWRNGYLYALETEVRGQVLAHPFNQTAPVALQHAVLRRFLNQFSGKALP